MACVAGGFSARLDTAIRLRLEDILCPLFNKSDGKRAPGLVIRRCELGEEAGGVDVIVPVAPVADLGGCVP